MKGFFHHLGRARRHGARRPRPSSLLQYLEEQGRPGLHTFEPGGTEIGRAIRELVLSTRWGSMASRTELLLMAADRAQHVEEVIRPALAKGLVVVCERYVDSTLAYQGYGLGEDLRLIDRANELATGDSSLTSPSSWMWTRRPRHPALPAAPRIGSKVGGAAFQARVREGYQQLCAAFPERMHLVSTEGDVEAVHRRIVDLVARCIGAGRNENRALQETSNDQGVQVSGEEGRYPARPFAQELRGASREEGEDLDELLAKVDELAERLIQAPSLELLEEYKTAVGSPPKGLGPGPQAGRAGFIDVRGRRRIFMLLRCVDERLADLAESFVRRQRGRD